MFDVSVERDLVSGTLHDLCAHYDERKAHLVEAFKKMRSQTEEDELLRVMVEDENTREFARARLAEVLRDTLSAERESYVALLIQKNVQKDRTIAQLTTAKTALEEEVRINSEAAAQMQRDCEQAQKHADHISRKCKEKLTALKRENSQVRNRLEAKTRNFDASLQE